MLGVFLSRRLRLENIKPLRQFVGNLGSGRDGALRDGALRAFVTSIVAAIRQASADSGASELQTRSNDAATRFLRKRFLR